MNDSSQSNVPSSVSTWEDNDATQSTNDGALPVIKPESTIIVPSSPMEQFTEDDSAINTDDEDMETDDDNTSQTGRKKRKPHIETKHRKTFMSIDVIAMRSCLHLNQKEAANKLNVSLSTLKRRFYEMREELGCDKWPYPPHKAGAPINSSTTTTITGQKRRHSADTSSVEDYSSPSEEETEERKPRTRRQSVTSANGKRRNSFNDATIQMFEDATVASADSFTSNSNSSYTYDFASRAMDPSNHSFERSNKKLKATHTGFLSSTLPDEAMKLSDFVYYNDNFVEQEESSEGDQPLRSTETTDSDEDFMESVKQRLSQKKSTTRRTCDLKKISGMTNSVDPKQREVFSAAILLVAFKQQQILSNALE